MDKTIEIAKCTLANIFGIKKEEFDRSITRKSNVVEARRYLIYFLVNELNLKFVNVPLKMKCISTHSSAIHHFYKMIYLMENDVLKGGASAAGDLDLFISYEVINDA